jgi:hypothetical protein
MSKQNIKIVTALFDIGRHDLGDGRTIEEYLKWFDVTLKIKCPMIVYTEEKFKKFVTDRRDPSNTEIIIQKLEETPAYRYLNDIERIIHDPVYLSKINDPSRIECKLGLYNVIQYSKFGWLKKSSENGRESDFYFWMDAGCSRFFEDFDLNSSWPNHSNMIYDKLMIQGNANTERLYLLLDAESYKWDSNCILVGTLFGGSRKIIYTMYDLIIDVLEKDMIMCNTVNNEQIALGMIFKKFPDLFSVYIKPNSGHLPIFKKLAEL